MTRVRILAALLAPTFVLAACGSGEASPSTVPAGTDLEVHAVPGLRFDKESYEVEAGESLVAYVNDDSIHHTLVVVQDGTTVSGFELAIYKKGEIDSGTVTLAAGTYELFCTVPGHQSMKASLTVK
jgi:plastocyanin